MVVLNSGDIYCLVTDQLWKMTILGKESKMHDRTFLNENTFARSVTFKSWFTFSKMTLLHGGSLLQEWLFLYENKRNKQTKNL